MKGINLITSAQRQLSRQRRVVWLATLALAGLLILVGLVGLGTWSIQLVISRQIESEQLEIQGLQQQITQFSQTEHRQQLIIDRLKAIKEIISTRPQLGQRLQELTDTFPDSVQLKQIQITGQNERAKVSVSSPSFAGFFSVIRILDAGGWPEVEITRINRDKFGLYQLSVEAMVQ